MSPQRNCSNLILDDHSFGLNGPHQAQEEYTHHAYKSLFHISIMVILLVNPISSNPVIKLHGPFINYFLLRDVNDVTLYSGTCL